MARTLSTSAAASAGLTKLAVLTFAISISLAQSINAHAANSASTKAANNAAAADKAEAKAESKAKAKESNAAKSSEKKKNAASNNNSENEELEANNENEENNTNANANSTQAGKGKKTGSGNAANANANANANNANSNNADGNTNKKDAANSNAANGNSGNNANNNANGEGEDENGLEQKFSGDDDDDWDDEIDEDREELRESFFFDQRDNPHPHAASSSATRRLILSFRKPKDEKLNICVREFRAIADSSLNAESLSQATRLMTAAVKRNLKFYHWCFYYFVSALDWKLDEDSLGLQLQDRMTIFTKNTKALWVLGGALDGANETKIYFEYLRIRYLEMSTKHFGRSLDVVSPPLGDPRWIEPQRFERPSGAFND
jgi:hypothetical protein